MMNSVSQLPVVLRWTNPAWLDYMNRALAKLRSPVVLRSRFDHREDMVSMEQVANFELLITELLIHGVPGAFVELGCYVGATSSVIANVIRRLAPGRTFHVYDRFDLELGSTKGIRGQFEAAMHAARLPLPVVHAGDIVDLLPAELPEQIAFAHIDLGTGGGVMEHGRIMHHALETVYPRVAPGGLLMLMDMHVPGATIQGHDSNPGVRIACERFFQNRPETIHLLYGGPCSHAYVRKV